MKYVAVDPITKLKVAKLIAPAIFTQKTPKFHIDIHNFLKKPSKYKVMCIFRGGGKTTSINKIDLFSRVFLENEKYTQIFSSTEKKAQAFISDLKTMIINAIKKKFNIKKGSVWTKSAIEVLVDDKHICYIETFSTGQDPRGSTYEFARPTLQIYDDIESNVGQYAIRTRNNREKLRDWFYKECLPALDPLYGKVIFIGTILHTDSLLNKILRNDKWDKLVIPIIQDGNSSWKDRFPNTSDEARDKEKQIFKETGEKIEVESIEDIKNKYEDLGQLKGYYQEYLCKAMPEESKLFRPEYFKYFSHIEYTTKEKYIEFENALEKKRVLIPEPINIVFEDGKKVALDNTVRYATKDQASSGSKTRKGNDDSVIVTAAYDSDGNMYILDISCGKWTPFDKSVNIMRTFKTFEYIRLGIESGGMQNEYFYTIAEFQKSTGIRVPVEEMSHAGVNKNIRISNLEVLFLAGKIFFNKSDPNTAKAEAEFLSFDIDIESDEDNIMDTIAYQRRFQAFKNHDTEEEEEDEESVW